ncbi:MAG: hypothetical protein HYR60_12915 [Acidobacteria bacterium]|nr:hypothetical protein [Acidobacteriota bacterium]MBI3472887.1 hypothetical protein [Candidatus Solibacter usitatus]
MRIGLALALTAAAVFAQTKAEHGKRVADAAIEALGGQRFLAMEDRVETGRAYSFYRERLSGLQRAKIYTRYLTRPEPPLAGFFGVRERQAFGKNEEAYYLLNENEGYDVSFHGARPIDPATHERFRETTWRNILYILRMRLGEPGLVIESRGSDVVDNQPVEVVEIADSDNRTVTVFFNASTKLPIRQEAFRRNPLTKEKVEEVTLFAKYRDVGGGVLWPFQIQRQRDGEKIFEIFSETVEINQGLTDNIFTLPTRVKILGKKK